MTRVEEEEEKKLDDEEEWVKTQNKNCIDIDLLINKLLELPQDDDYSFLENFLNISGNAEESNMNEKDEVQNGFHNLERDSGTESGVTSSDILSPGSGSLSTPIQNKMFLEKGTIVNGGKDYRGLDLRSP